MTKKSAEVVFIPSPGVGHLGSTVEIAKLLLDHDDRLSITVLIMKLPYQTDVTAFIDNLVDSAYAAADMSERRIKFVDLATLDGYDSSAESNPGLCKTFFIESQKPLVRKIVDENIVRSGSARSVLVGFVVDMFCTTMIDVANEFGVPTYVFYTCNAGFLSLSFHFQSLNDDHGVDLAEFKNDSSTELVVPSFVHPIPASSLPYVMVEKSWASVLYHLTRRMRETKGIIVNTFLELESHAISSLCDGVLPKVYPVGPMLNLKRNSRAHFIFKWLDDQPDSSVVFLCFGSMGCFHVDQVKEIACALEHSGLRFLWALRQPPPKDDQKSFNYTSPGDYENPSEILPEGFIDQTAERGRVIGWAPQVDILSHPAIGGFVSHCGWNSILESLWFGVPVATLPLYAEQHSNAFQLVKELGSAVDLKLDYKSGFYCENDRTVVGAQEIEEGIMRLMVHDSDDVRKRVKEMSEKSKKALMEDGITRCDPPYTVVLRLLACKRESPWSKGDTNGVNAKSTPMLKFGGSGDPDGSYFEWSRRIDILWVYGYLASTRRMPRALPFGTTCQPVKDGVARAAWAEHPQKDLLVVGEVLLRPCKDDYTINNSPLSTPDLHRPGVLVTMWTRKSGQIVRLPIILVEIDQTSRHMSLLGWWEPSEFVQSYRELLTTAEKTIICKPRSKCTRSPEKVVPLSPLYSYYEKISDLPGDSKNDLFSEEVNLTGSSESTDSFDSATAPPIRLSRPRGL
ncbi:hypothetical protein TIFTF001_001591 [Ficus carica]|uniref:UDP-glycosyltransferase n=1 Tax=Ficus carica TaxID=3494 RepID=A0AA87Z9R8_FICCA|nr:hypothetical protein TIFTF001_001591 [Ficus carica]